MPERDTAASAVVLNEFGEAFFDEGGNYNLLFKYHIKIKILKKAGLGYADIEIPLMKDEGKVELLRSVKASSFNLVNGVVDEIPLKNTNIFSEKLNKRYDVKKIAIPGVRVGSVIELQYVLESPFIFNFRN